MIQLLFARDFFGFNAKDYQAEFLRDKGKRIVFRWSRQVGKTTCIALSAIWFALTNQKTLTLIVAPTLRQSMIVSDRIQDFLLSLPKDSEKSLVDRVQRTTIRFKNGSRIIALPNNPQLLRGYTAPKLSVTRAPSSRKMNLSSSACFTLCCQPLTEL